MCTTHFCRRVGYLGGVEYIHPWIPYPSEYPTPEYHTPTQKGHGKRDNLPPERMWDQGLGRDLAPEILYLPVNRMIDTCENITSPPTSLAGSKNKNYI